MIDRASQRLLWIVDRSCRNSIAARRDRLVARYPAMTLRIFASDPEIADVLTNLGIAHTNEADYVRPTTEGYREAKAGLQLIEGLERLTLPSGETIRSLTMHSGVSLWELHRAELLLYGFERIVKQIDLAGAMLDKERPQRIVCSALVHDVVTLSGLRLDRVRLRFVKSLAASRSIPFMADWRMTARWPFRSATVTSCALPWLSLAKTWFLRLRLPRDASRSGGHGVHVLALNHTTRNAEALIPVVQQLGTSRRWNTLVVQIGPQGADELRQAGIAHTRWEHYCTLAGAAATLATTLRLWRNWHRLTNAVRDSRDGRAAWRFGEADLLEAVPDGLQFLWLTLAQGARNCEIAKRVIDLTRPCVLLGTNERSGTFRAFYETGRRRSIPSLSIQYGAIDLHPMWRIPLGSDVMAVEGQAMIDTRAKGGAPPDRGLMIITGQPKYDTLLTESPRRLRERVFKEFGIPAGSRLVVYTTHAQREVRWARGRILGTEDIAYAAEIRAVCGAIAEMKDTFLIVKPHPHNDDPRLHADIIHEVGASNLALSPQTGSVYPMVLACDLLITRSSQTGVDALVFGKPLVIVNLTGEPDFIPFPEFGAALGVYAVDDVKPVIADALSDPTVIAGLAAGREKFVAYYTRGQDGRASSRVAALVEDLIAGHPPAELSPERHAMAGKAVSRASLV